jgi:hypothetical protein
LICRFYSLAFSQGPAIHASCLGPSAKGSFELNTFDTETQEETMIPQLLPKVFTAFAILSVVSAHIELSWPYPLRSKFNPDSPKDLIDYDMINPLFANGESVLQTQPHIKDRDKC